MNVFLHIGLHKTGTTYLQNNIFNNLKEFHYVHLPPWRLLTQTGLTDQQLCSYKMDILKGWDSQKDLIISSEFFSGNIEKFTKSESITILDNLKRIFPEAQIILVLRNPRGYFNSLYNFRVITRGFCTQSISNYYNQNKKYLLEKFDYQYLLNALNERFSKTNWIKYEQIKNNNQYVAFICEAMGISFFEVANDVKENTSSKKDSRVNAHLFINRLFLMSLLEMLPDSKWRNYLKIKYFNFKKTKALKRITQRIEQWGFVANKKNVLNLQQEKELQYYVKQYDEL